METVAWKLVDLVLEHIKVLFMAVSTFSVKEEVKPSAESEER